MNQKILDRREDGVVSGFSKILNSGELWMYYLPTVLYSDDLLIPVACFNYRRFKPAWIETHKALPVTPSSFSVRQSNFFKRAKATSAFSSLEAGRHTDTQFSVVSSPRVCVRARASTGTQRVHAHNCKQLGFDSWLVLVPLPSG